LGEIATKTKCVFFSAFHFVMIIIDTEGAGQHSGPLSWPSHGEYLNFALKFGDGRFGRAVCMERKNTNKWRGPH
jgi:hypothetical protein